ncbi:hypothetical protein [Dyella silvatica]|uniref:hypothetical protein n=1 Tax=Dyella silvatica TaxID=2992128 RepID=UPI002250ECB3|nr:hypothetical protein [Dyella silvatica]
MEPLPLSFTALDAQIEQTPQHPSYSVILSQKTKWGFAMAALGGALGLLSVKVLPNNQLYTLVLAGVFVAVELIGVIVIAVSQLPRKWPTFTEARRELAEELDLDLPNHAALIHWLGTFPRDQLETLSDYVSYRRDRMQERLPLLTGSIEKLGALPIVIALYLQFKDMRWPPHPSWTEIFLIFALLLSYGASLLQISVRFRLQRYDALLKKALSTLDKQPVVNPT